MKLHAHVFLAVAGLMTLGALHAQSSSIKLASPPVLSNSPEFPLNCNAPCDASLAGSSAAEAALREQLAKDPALLSALVSLASLLEQSGRTRAAAALWRRATALRPQDAALQQALAQDLIEAGRDREAISVLRAINASHPDLEASQLALGLALARDEQFAEARGPLEAALALQPDDDVAQLSLAKVLITLLQYEDAAPHVRAYAKKHPDAFDSHYLSGLVASKENQPVVAERELTVASNLDPSNYDVQVNLGRVLLANGHSEAAIAHLQAAAALRPTAPETFYELSRAFRAVGDGPRSEAALVRMQECRKEQAVDRQVSVFKNQGAAALEKGAYTEAEQAYLAAIALQPRDATARENLAVTYGRLGREKEEEAELEEAARLDPLDASILGLQAELAASSGQADRARTLFKRALVAEPDNAVALGGLGVLAAQSGALSQGEAWLQQSVESDPAYWEGYRNLGLVLAAEKRYPEAGDALHRSLAGNGDHTLAWTAIGRVEMAQDKTRTAIEAFRAALANAPGCSPVRVELAEALAHQAEYESALAELGVAARVCTGLVEADVHREKARVFCALKRPAEAQAESKQAQPLHAPHAEGANFSCSQ